MDVYINLLYWCVQLVDTFNAKERVDWNSLDFSYTALVKKHADTYRVCLVAAEVGDDFCQGVTGCDAVINDKTALSGDLAEVSGDASAVGVGVVFGRVVDCEV